MSERERVTHLGSLSLPSTPRTATTNVVTCFSRVRGAARGDSVSGASAAAGLPPTPRRVVPHVARTPASTSVPSLGIPSFALPAKLTELHASYLTFCHRIQSYGPSAQSLSYLKWCQALEKGLACYEIPDSQRAADASQSVSHILRPYATCLGITAQVTQVDVSTACYSRQCVRTLRDWSEGVVKSRAVINTSVSPQDSRATGQSSKL